jgi:hypothetical protein
MATFRTKTKWRDKVNKIKEIEMVDIPPKMQERFGKGKMLIPRPVDIERLVSTVKKGKLITKSELRRKLAEESKADVTCPLTTGIFLRIVSEAAEEDFQGGRKKIAPYWRVIGDNGELNEKIPGGAESQAKKLEEEGIRIEVKKRSGKLFAVEYEGKLVRL